MKILTLILQLLSTLAKVFEKRQRDREQQAHEEQKQRAQDDPAGWFDDHFNGDAKRVLDTEADDRADGMRTDAGKASEAKPTKPDENK